MATLYTLPDELLISIFTVFRKYSEHIPRPGENGCWTSPDKLIFAKKLSQNASSEGDYKTLLSLRRTNRLFNSICIPLIFEELNMLGPGTTYEIAIPLRYAEHIRTFRVVLDPGWHIDIESDGNMSGYTQNISQVLTSCHNLTSIAIYHHLPDAAYETFIEPIATLLESGSLKHLGLYSWDVVEQEFGSHFWNAISGGPAIGILTSLAGRSTASKALKRLDIATETMPTTTYDLLRSKFVSLESLSVRRSLRNEAVGDLRLGRLWDPHQVSNWVSYGDLTTLNLIDCSSAYAPHIPPLVGLFKALKYLIISTCGDDDGYEVITLPYNWRYQPDALCNTRRPLETFHIEHMLTWEIISLGIIPTKTLIASSLEHGHLEEALQSDPDLFPALKTLHIQAAYEASSSTMSGPTTLGAICQKRGIEMKRDAGWIKRDFYRF